MFSDFFSLLYPNLCCGCGSTLVKSEVAICSDCLLNFPYTQFTSFTDNPVARSFWGRVPLKGATGLIAFNKGHRIQRVLHSLKYEGNQAVGEELGKHLGRTLKRHNAQPSLIVPIPLHRKKLKARGYNQSTSIAKGVAAVLGCPIETKGLRRVVASSTQTNKSRIDRWDNVSDIFAVTDPDRFESHDVLLVDDVITTGATLEACAQVLHKGPVKSVQVASLACVI